MSFTLKILSSIEQISPTQWNALCTNHYPFIRHEFLCALELSNCTNTRTGWTPHHICIYQAQSLIAIIPTYQKSHSNGEYVFDWDWANAYASHDIPYYPKLVSAIPFSPCYGPRIASKLPLSELLPFIQQSIVKLCEEKQLSSWHGLFLEEKDTKQLQAHGFLTRTGLQYHWHNQDYVSFAHYLEHFTSRKRKGIKRERRIVAEQNIQITAIEGENIDNKLLREFYYCYHLTYLKRGRKGYLNENFFARLLKSMPDQIVLFVAKHQDNTVACAWCFKNTDVQDSTLYGRYWGCLDTFDNLHFETCYYQGLEYCIKHKIQRFDPGAQGEHKIQRGFKPINTYSNHYIQHPQFSDAIEDFLDRESTAIEDYKQQLSSLLPFKQKD